MKYYFVASGLDSLVRLERFIIHPAESPPSNQIPTVEGDVIVHSHTPPSQFSLVYRDSPPTSPFRVVCENFTFYDCEIVNIQPVEQIITGYIGSAQNTAEADRETVQRMIQKADEPA